MNNFIFLYVDYCFKNIIISYMKKFLIIFTFIVFLFCPVFGADIDKFDSSYDAFDSNIFDNPFGGQKQYTDEDFQKALEEKKAQLNKKKKKKLKGDAHSDTDANQKIDETSERCIILMLSQPLINGDGTYIPVGHYKIIGIEESDNVYLDFYQAHSKIARVPAIKTKYDFEQQEINFAKILPYSDTKIKIIFGSLDFNAWTLVRVVN